MCASAVLVCGTQARGVTGDTRAPGRSKSKTLTIESKQK